MKGTSSIQKYKIENKVGDGTFGVVLKARNKEALKKILTVPNNSTIARKGDDQGVPVTTLREIKLLKKANHRNVVELLEVAYERGELLERKRGVSYMVFPYMDHDLAGLLSNPNVTLAPNQIKSYTKQLLKGVEYLHRNDIIHRDIKCANILVNDKGEVKLADFGLARDFSKNEMTAKVVTLWYRAPELLLSDGEKFCKYTTAIDIWGIGCVFGELWRRVPLLPGKDEIDQLTRIFALLGSPTDSTWPEFKNYPIFKSGVKDFPKCKANLSSLFAESSYHDSTYSLLKKLLKLNPSERLTATKALSHDYFVDRPRAAEVATSDFNVFPQSHELEFRNKRHDILPHVEIDKRNRSK